VECVAAERISLCEWMTRKVKGFQASSSSEAEALEKTRAMLGSLINPGEGSENSNLPTPEGILESAGNSTAGFLARVQEMNALYDEDVALLKMPLAEYLTTSKAFNEKIAQNPNQLVRVFFPAFEKCRLKEFMIETKLAMLHAAVAYRQSGAAGLASVPDPLTQQPFEFRRFVLNGVDRGFELRSKAPIYEWPSALIFVEKDGPAFNLDGPSVGKPTK
jgi:hypothetical protein